MNAMSKSDSIKTTEKKETYTTALLPTGTSAVGRSRNAAMPLFLLGISDILTLPRYFVSVDLVQTVMMGRVSLCSHCVPSKQNHNNIAMMENHTYDGAKES